MFQKINRSELLKDKLRRIKVLRVLRPYQTREVRLTPPGKDLITAKRQKQSEDIIDGLSLKASSAVCDWLSLGFHVTASRSLGLGLRLACAVSRHG